MGSAASTVSSKAAGLVFSTESAVSGWDDIHSLTDNWYLNFVLNNVIYLFVSIWEYFTVGYWSYMYVICFPIFMLWNWVDNWSIHDVGYNIHLDKIGLNFI